MNYTLLSWIVAGCFVATWALTKAAPSLLSKIKLPSFGKTAVPTTMELVGQWETLRNSLIAANKTAAVTKLDGMFGDLRGDAP